MTLAFTRQGGPYKSGRLFRYLYLCCIKFNLYFKVLKGVLSDLVLHFHEVTIKKRIVKMNAADTKAPCKSLAPKTLDPTVPTMQHTCHLSNSMPRVYDEGFPSIF